MPATSPNIDARITFRVKPRESAPLVQPNSSSSEGANIAKEVLAAAPTNIASQAAITITQP